MWSLEVTQKLTHTLKVPEKNSEETKESDWGMTQIFKLLERYLKIMINVLKSIVKKTDICINR